MNKTTALIVRCGTEPWRAMAETSRQTLAPGEPFAVELASGGHWFGHGFNHVQPWPLESGSLVNPTFAVNNIQSPIWLCSNGYAILADTTELLDVRVNENGDGLLRILCPSAPITVRLFRGETLPEARAALMSRLGWPAPPPAAHMLGDSLFCSWTQYPRAVTQDRIIGMARSIRHYEYPCSTLILDDRWESCFGELRFSRDFPAPKAMVETLHELGFRVWLWVTPFVNREASSFGDLAARRLLVPDRQGRGAALMRWWGGTAGLVDVTNPDGREWYASKLRALKNDLGVDGFKIDGGDFKYQPNPAESAWHDFQGPSGYMDRLLAVFEELAPNQCETRTAWLSQRRGILWREGGKDTHWGLDNGLQALVTLALHLGLMGYDLLIPDMVPGRMQTLQSDHPMPTDELMVRWTEASAFMPMLQFSYFPWNFAPETQAVVRSYAWAHKALEPYLAEQARDRRAPLLRPIWYDSPLESSLYAVADEFMLGSDLLAAPVLTEGRVVRDIALPPGDWIDAWNGTAHGAGRLADYPAPCPGMPLFVRSGRSDLLRALSPGLKSIERGGIKSGRVSATYRAGLDRDLNVSG